MTNPNQLTLPEVLAQLDSLRDHCRSMVDEADPEDIWSCDVEALDAAIAALRGPTREQVERLRGKWIRWDGCPECSVCEYQDTSVVDDDARTLLCPACGAPMYDKAVEILMGRLEGLQVDDE